ncbi:hypothetical protein MmiEs2_09120 [Methanimicrococcus stummii]|uniref:Uncharacterized protein n=1 Tax=Methanimicrococcus stummii TaxID=3028294 RepID=A0AA96V8T8_9EURY|nr:hypothetical protein [Methanimicrococcus sp. Es2]WNY28709.1 hypothetical protein MmiEs2_09120 [Methanimicrococcus sp. Es2]
MTKIKLAIIGILAAAFFLVAILSVTFPESTDPLKELYSMLTGFFRGLGAPAGYITVYSAYLLGK